MLQQYPISVFFAPPTAYAMTIQENLQKFKMNSNLRHCTSAGEPLVSQLNT